MIESIWLKHFRKHRGAKFVFDERFNVITGRNNAGKTSIFLAIEYCLFGLPAGFKRVSQLTTFGADDLGVQMTFRARDGERYKLQRMHVLDKSTSRGSKARKAPGTVKGAFTLKQLVRPTPESDAPEAYSLASEHGDREEQLSLKISELLGFSKRSFHEAVTFSQGEIASVLKGPPNLDIVLGLNAAAALGDAFGARALDFKKECVEMERVSIQLAQATTDKKDAEKSIAEGDKKSGALRASMEEATRQLDHLATVKQDHAALASHLEHWDATTQRGRQQASVTSTLEAQLASLGEQLGPLDALGTVLDEARAGLGRMIAEKTSASSELERELRETRDLLREREREKGDVAGVLGRRVQSKDAPACEHCGAPIDPSKIAGEIQHLETTLAALDTQIQEMETRIAGLEAGNKTATRELQVAAQQAQVIEATAGKLRMAVQQLPEGVHRGFTGRVPGASEVLPMLHEVNAWLASVTNIHEKLASAKRDAAEQANREASARESARATVNRVVNRYAPGRGSWLSEPPVNDASKTGVMEGIGQLMARTGIAGEEFEDGAVAMLKNELQSFVVAKSSELSTLISATRRQLDDVLAAQEQDKRKALTADKTIAMLSARLDELKIKEDLSKQYAAYKRVFADIQTKIRETAASTLERTIIEHHRSLSSVDEFSAVRVEPADYSLHVQPRASTTGEFYPASLYEGGGHKLILGLAYKLALGKLIGVPPFLLVDEPTEFMDTTNKKALMQGIPVLAKDSQVLLVTHQDIDGLPAGKTIHVGGETA